MTVNPSSDIYKQEANRIVAVVNSAPSHIRRQEEEKLQTRPARQRQALLEEEVHSFMEPLSGAESSTVRRQLDSETVQLYRELPAQVFKHVEEIYSRENKNNLDTSGEKSLLTCEANRRTSL